MELINANCLDALMFMDDNSIDSIVTDPPAGISFMGKDWDHHKGGRNQWIAWLASILKECNRVLKPGGHALVWSIPRTSHWTGMACEDAGFEVRDQISHIFGSGFPKSHNLKEDWKGWGSALKPSREDWWLCRKPLSESTLAKNVVKHGTGAINIDGCRIGTDIISTHGSGDKYARMKTGQSEGVGEYREHTGRWPSHTIFDEDAAQVLDDQSGVLKSGELKGYNIPGGSFNGRLAGKGKRLIEKSTASSGGASRFFYVAKASKSERNKGCEGLPEKIKKTQMRGANGTGNKNFTGGFQDSVQQNTHPTVKPIKLMEYLIKLITPPNGTVLDPFMGSGSTGVAAKNLGMSFIGIEREKEYFEIAQRRIL